MYYFFCRSESRRNSHSSDSISRKYRHSGARKKQISQRKNESLKANKTSKGRLVQVNINCYLSTLLKKVIFISITSLLGNYRTLL